MAGRRPSPGHCLTGRRTAVGKFGGFHLGLGFKPEGALAEVVYIDCWKEGLFDRRRKLDWLTDGSVAGELPNGVIIDRGLLDDWRPKPFDNDDWLSIREAFAFSKSGMKSGNDPVFVAPHSASLRRQVEPVLAGRDDPSFNASVVRALA